MKYVKQIVETEKEESVGDRDRFLYEKQIPFWVLAFVAVDFFEPSCVPVTRVGALVVFPDVLSFLFVADWEAVSPDSEAFEVWVDALAVVTIAVDVLDTAGSVDWGWGWVWVARDSDDRDVDFLFFFSGWEATVVWEWGSEDEAEV